MPHDLAATIRTVLPALLCALAACTRGGAPSAAGGPSADGVPPITEGTPSAPHPSSGATVGATSGASEEFLARCRAAAAYSRDNDGEVMLVLLDGKPVFEDTAPGFTVRTPHALASGSKSFVGVAAMCAVADGLLTLDEPVSDTIQEWKGDPRKSAVTIRQLLSLASGLESLSAKIDSQASARAAGITDRAQASIAARSLAAPGERFIYGPSSFYVFGELLTRKLAAAKTGDRDMEAYLDRRIFTPLGIKPSFLRDPAGNANFAGGCRLNAIDWARFGEFMRHGGTHEGATLLAPELVAELTRATGPNPRYGLTWWLLRAGDGNAEDSVADGLVADRLEARDGPIRRRLAQRLRERTQESATQDASDGNGSGLASQPLLGYSAAGKGKQRLLVLPEHRLTVVRFGPVDGSKGFENARFIELLLGSPGQR